MLHKVLPDLKLVIEFFRGQFNISDYLELKYREINDPEFNPDYNFIGDLRNSEIVANAEDIRKCVSFIKSRKQLVSNRRLVVITATPNQVVFSTLFQKYGYELPIHFEVVSTLHGALKWVGCSFEDYETVEKTLAELNNNSFEQIQKSKPSIRFEGRLPYNSH